MVKIKNEVAKAFDAVAEYYDRYMEETGHVQAQRKISRFLAKVNDGLTLDVGTGTGIMLEPFEDGVGIDISRKMIKIARQKNSHSEFMVADAHYLPFRDKAFKTAVSCLIFLWLDDPEEALREILRVSEKAYIVEEEGVPARKRVMIPEHLKSFFELIGKLEREVSVPELDAYRSSLMYGRTFEADIDGSHKFVVYEVVG